MKNKLKLLLSATCVCLLITTLSGWTFYGTNFPDISPVKQVPNWCVFACQEMLERENNQCYYATCYAQEYLNLSENETCCRDVYPGDIGIKCILQNGVSSSNIAKWLSKYHEGGLSSVGKVTAYFCRSYVLDRLPCYGVMTDWSHCVVIFGVLASGEDFAPQTATIYYIDPQFNTPQQRTVTTFDLYNFYLYM